MKFVFKQERRFIPPVHPPGEDRPPRQHPTTQVTVSPAEWPENLFRLWLPEHVEPGLWSNMKAAEADQRFENAAHGGLQWSYERPGLARINAELVPASGSLLLEVDIVNRSRDFITGVSVMNCLQMSQATAFACDDFGRLFIRSGGSWRSLFELKPRSDYPTYYRQGYLEGGGVGVWGGKLDGLTEPARADHPLMVCVSKEGKRAVGIAADRYYFLFHNRANRNLLCIHSNSEPLPLLEPDQETHFRQKIYFSDGGLDGCIAAYDADPPQSG